MASSKKSQIEALLTPAVRALGLDLWGVELALSNSRGLLRVYIDHAERPITLTDCEAVSRESSALLDVHDPIAGNYTLEVSSPGLDRPLYEPAQYTRFVGEQARVQTQAPIGGRRRFQGRIVAVEGNSLILDIDSGPVTLAFADIDKARLVPQFEPALSARKARGGK
jgi:ribosome maturation factor RimP